ncbi:MAG TPA: tRNA pseudouridine(13) synthase TruD [Planctomycetota bacterium]|nr:tRNA pseudouridine(13) synthase TruD [Planctomycetota bacterium]
MKVKSIPEDFVVIEIDSLQPGAVGGFALYTLRKRAMGTFEAVAAISRELDCPRNDIGIGGLKDKWAVTEQALTIRDGPPRSIQGGRFELVYRGRVPEPLKKGGFDRNAFRITLRGLTEGEVTHLQRGLEEVRAHGLPNYFDSQRFGSSRGSNDFIGRRLVRGEHEAALKLAVATPTHDDPPKLRKIRRQMAEGWGGWEKLASELPRRSMEHRIADRLARRTGDFAGAFGLIDESLRRLYASAYQSYLWNQTLRGMIKASGVPTVERAYEVGTLLFPRALPPGLKEARIPFPRRGVAPPPAMETAVAAEGLRMEDLKLKGIPGTFFVGGDREAWVFPMSLVEPEVAPDELNPGASKAALRFELPRGSYATLVVKRLFH